MATSLTLLQPFNIDTANTFTFANVTVTGNVTSGNANLGNIVISNYFSGNGSLLTGITASSANTAATVTTNAQPNITSVGTLSSLTSTGLITATSGGIKVGNIQDPSGTNTIQLSSGSITVTGNITAGGGGTGNVTATYFIGNGSLLTNLTGGNITGQVANSLITGTVYTNAQPNITSVGTLTNLTVTGNVTSGNANLGNAVTANYFIGNGSLLTGLPASYSNTNVAAYLPTYTGNFTANNATISNTLTASTIVTSGSSGNITGANYINANYFTGTLTTGSQPNITSTGTLTSLTVTGNITSGNANLGNAVVANYFVGNGSLLTGLPASYSNTNVASYLPTYTGNFTAGNANVTGNVTATYFIGNGSQLTGLPASYSNTNVAAYLPTYTGNFTAGNANIGGTLLSSTGITTTGAAGNISGANYVIASYFSGNGSTLTSLTGANVTGYVPLSTAANTAGTVTTAAQPNITSTGTLVSLVVSGDATVAGNLTVSGSYEYANVTSFNVKDPIIEQGGNPNGTPLASNDGKDRGQILHYYSSAAIDAFMGWDNSNSEFAFGSNVSVSSEVVTFNNFGNIRAGYYLGNGSQLTSLTGSSVSGNVTSAVQSHYANIANSVTGTNVSGNVTSAVQSHYANIANSVTGTNVSGNVTSAVQSHYANIANSITGTNVSGNVTSAIQSHYANIANSVAGTDVSGNVTSAVQSHYANIANSVTGGNVSGQVGNALIAGTVYTNAQPNITSVGTLSSLTVTANATVGNLLTNNLLYANGTAWSFGSGGGATGIAIGSVELFTADGSGNTYTLTTTPSNEDQITVNIDGVIQLHSSFSLSGNVVTMSGTPVSGAKVEITNFNSGGAAGSNTQVQFNDGGNIAGTAALTFDKSSNTLNATNITANGAGVATTGKAIAMAIVFGF